MAGSAFKDPGVVQVMKRFSPVLVDGDAHPQEASAMGATGYPTVVFCNAEGKAVASIQGLVDPDEFRARAERAAELAGAPD